MRHSRKVKNYQITGDGIGNIKPYILPKRKCIKNVCQIKLCIFSSVFKNICDLNGNI